MEALRPQDPTSIGAYAVLARLGAGGMGQVYLGRSPGGRQVALKVIREDFAESPEALARFRREVETVRAVRSAYTANIIDASLAAAPYWLATEYVPGPTLADAVRQHGALPGDTCFRLFAALAEALAGVHEYGVLHRDLKPHNVILSAVGPKLIDFGIARAAEQTALTRTGTAPGTPGYTAPEVITRNAVATASDVFALGATMAAVATGRPPYGEGSLESVAYRVVHGEIDVQGVEPRLAGLIRDCVAGDPAQRPTPAQVIERCAVTSALVEDPFYRVLVGAGPGAVAGVGYVPTVVPGPAMPQARQPRTKLWLAVGAASVAAGVVAGLLIQKAGDTKGDSGEGKPAAIGAAATPAPATSGAAKPGAASPSGDADGTDGAEPGYIEATNPNRDYWAPKEGSPGAGQCGLPAEERPGQAQLQASIVSAEDPSAREMSGKVKISVRFKYADPALPRPYYVSVSVKPPHEIDSRTGRPFEGLSQDNLGLGYSSKPVALLKQDSKGFGAPWVEMTYPDDFRVFVNGKPYAPAIPVGNDPGNWTVLFHHVKSPKEYASIDCRGFIGKQ
ncbi:serine/threonine-protein kinase [Streptomyces luteosporeus]|uniref:serine/threonine-protein kinase n=1 Tax=Streptomyces luteosporeus TaxID=173856 RepID=UPI0031CF4D83